MILAIIVVTSIVGGMILLGIGVWIAYRTCRKGPVSPASIPSLPDQRTLVVETEQNDAPLSPYLAGLSTTDLRDIPIPLGDTYPEQPLQSHATVNNKRDNIPHTSCVPSRAQVSQKPRGLSEPIDRILQSFESSIRLDFYVQFKNVLREILKVSHDQVPLDVPAWRLFFYVDLDTRLYLEPLYAFCARYQSLSTAAVPAGLHTALTQILHDFKQTQQKAIDFLNQRTASGCPEPRIPFRNAAWCYLDAVALSEYANTDPTLAVVLGCENTHSDAERLANCFADPALQPLFWQFFCWGRVRDQRVYETIHALLPWHPQDVLWAARFIEQVRVFFPTAHRGATFDITERLKCIDALRPMVLLNHTGEAYYKDNPDTVPRAPFYVATSLSTGVFANSQIELLAWYHTHGKCALDRMTPLFFNNASDVLWHILKIDDGMAAWWSVMEQNRWLSAVEPSSKMMRENRKIEVTTFLPAPPEKLSQVLRGHIVYEWVRLLRLPVPSEVLPHLPRISAGLVAIFHDLEARLRNTSFYSEEAFFGLWSIIGDLMAVMMQQAVSEAVIASIVSATQQPWLCALYTRTESSVWRGAWIRYLTASQRSDEVRHFHHARMASFFVAEKKETASVLLQAEQLSAWKGVSLHEDALFFSIEQIRHWLRRAIATPEDVHVGEMMPTVLAYLQRMIRHPPAPIRGTATDPLLLEHYHYNGLFWQTVYADFTEALSRQLTRMECTAITRVLLTIFVVTWPHIRQYSNYTWHHVCPVNEYFVVMLRWLQHQVVHAYLIHSGIRTASDSIPSPPPKKKGFFSWSTTAPTDPYVCRAERLQSLQWQNKVVSGRALTRYLVQLRQNLLFLQGCVAVEAFDRYDFVAWWFNSWPAITFTPSMGYVRSAPPCIDAMTEWLLYFKNPGGIAHTTTEDYYHHAMARAYTMCHWVGYPACLMQAEGARPAWILPYSALWPLRAGSEIVWHSPVWQEVLSFLDKAYLSAQLYAQPEIAWYSACNSGLIYTILFQYAVKKALAGQGPAHTAATYLKQAKQWFDCIGYHPMVEYYRAELYMTEMKTQGVSIVVNTSVEDVSAALHKQRDFLAQPAYVRLGEGTRMTLFNAGCISTRASVTVLFPKLTHEYQRIAATTGTSMRPDLFGSMTTFVIYWLYAGAQEGYDLLGMCTDFYIPWLAMLDADREAMNVLCLQIALCFGQHASDCKASDPVQSHYYQIVKMYYWLYISREFRKQHTEERAFISDVVQDRSHMEVNDAALEICITTRLAGLFNSHVSARYVSQLKAHTQFFSKYLSEC